MKSLIAQSHAALEKLPIEERAKIPGGLPDELSIKDIATLWAPEDAKEQSALMTVLIELCKNDKLDYYGNIQGWSYKGDFFDGTNNNPFSKVTTALTTPDTFSDSQFAYKASAGPHHCLIHKHELKLYLQSQNQWPVKNCLLANWWHELEHQAEPDEDPRLKYANKFGETLSLSELMQRWGANYNFVNELCFAKELTPYWDSRIGTIERVHGIEVFIFQKWFVDRNTRFIDEDADASPKYETLPEDAFFYWTDVLNFEDKHPEIKSRLIGVQGEINEPYTINSQAIDGEKTVSFPILEYGDQELSPANAIGFYPAMKLLGDDWTAEEFALQVFYGGIRAFEKSKTDGLLRPVINIQEWLILHGKVESFSGEVHSIKKVLLQFNYSKSELSKFKPEYRYISFNCVKTYVSEIIGSLEDAKEFLVDAIEQQTICAFHPFVGNVKPELSLNGMRWAQSFFPGWKIAKWIKKEFNKDLPELAVNSQSELVEESKEKIEPRNGIYGERDADALAWLRDYKPDIENMTISQIKTALKIRNPKLWGKGFEDWYRDQKVIGKKKPGRKALNAVKKINLIV